MILLSQPQARRAKPDVGVFGEGYIVYVLAKNASLVTIERYWCKRHFRLIKRNFALCGS